MRYDRGRTSEKHPTMHYTANTQMSAAALIFSNTVLLQRLFRCCALLSAALIFSATALRAYIAVAFTFGIFTYLINLMAFQSIKIVLI